MPSYVGRARWQFDPREHTAGYIYTHEDCWACVAAWAADSGSRGALTPTDQAIRHAAGRDQGDPKVVGPGNVADTARALAAFKIGMQMRVANAAEAARLLSTPAEAVYILPTDFNLWPGGKRCQPNFTGLHMVGVVAGAGPKGALQVMNPLCATGGRPRFERVPLAAVLAAAQGYGKAHGLPAGSIEVGVVMVPKAVPPPGGSGTVDRWSLPLRGAGLRSEPRRAARVFALAAHGSRLQVAAGPSGATPAASGAPSSAFLEVRALAGHLISPPAWVLADKVGSRPPSRASAPPPTPSHSASSSRPLPPTEAPHVEPR